MGLAVVSSGAGIHKEAKVAKIKTSGKPAKQLKKARKLGTVKPLVTRVGGDKLKY
jgi:hypothetical protein